MHRPLTPASPAQTRLGLLAVCVVAGLFGAPGLLDESVVSLHGDMPKYLMNGVYMLDLLRDRPFTSLDVFFDYTRLYFARYPALTLGHHPPLVSAAAVPMFAVFGVSVVAAKLVIFGSFLAAAAYLYALTKNIYGAKVGLLAGLLLATSPQTVLLGRSVLSEMPALALVLASAYCLERFLATGRRQALVGFVVAATLGLYAKQLTLVVFPAYLVAAGVVLGFRRLARRDLMMAGVIVALAALPLVPVTLILSKANVEWTLAAMQHAPRDPQGLLARTLVAQLTPVVLLLSALGVVVSVWTRDRRAVFFIVWAGATLFSVLLFGRVEPARYGIYAVPALCVLAASLVGLQRPRVAPILTAVLVFAGVHQAWTASRVELPGAGGYEDAARFVLESEPGATVLFSADVDTGLFTFFVRKHDAKRGLVVLRSDKLLTTSRMGEVDVHNGTGTSVDLYESLQRLGTRFVVIEDRPSQSPVLERLRGELKTGRFRERWRAPIVTTDRRLRGTSLSVYEFLDAGPPDPNAELAMDLPIIRNSLAVRLSDLTERKYLR